MEEGRIATACWQPRSSGLAPQHAARVPGPLHRLQNQLRLEAIVPSPTPPPREAPMTTARHWNPYQGHGFVRDVGRSLSLGLVAQGRPSRFAREPRWRPVGRWGTAFADTTPCGPQARISLATGF